MSRDYGRLGSSRRSGSAIWQWMIIGAVLGFGCAAVAFLALLVTNQIQIDPNGFNRVTPTERVVVQVVTPTLDPNAPTITPVIITATSEPLPTQQSEVIVPSSTPPVLDEPTPTEEAVASTDETTVETNPTATTETGSTDSTGSTTDGSIIDTNAGNGGTRNLTSGGIAPELEGIGSILMPVQGGSFIMGTNPAEAEAAWRVCVDNGGACEVDHASDSYPAHTVNLDSFRIEQTEVSLEQYVIFLNYLKSTGVDHLTGCGGQQCIETKIENSNTNIAYDTNLYTVEPTFVGNLPVTFVSWYGADAYCKALGRRLPTEAEWEFAARGPGGNIYPWGNELVVENASTSRLVNAEGAPLGMQPVAAIAVQGPFGTYNQAGNVSEWVADWYGAYQQAEATNPTGPAAGSQKVHRGGNWAYNPFYARTMHRLSANPGDESPTIGFRCAADAEDPASSLGTTGSTGTTGSIGNVTLEAPVGTPDPANLGVIGSSTEPVGGAPTLEAGPTQGSLPPGG